MSNLQLFTSQLTSIQYIFLAELLFYLDINKYNFLNLNVRYLCLFKKRLFPSQEK